MGKTILSLVLNKPADVDRLTYVLDAPSFEVKMSKVKGLSWRTEGERVCGCIWGIPVHHSTKNSSKTQSLKTLSLLGTEGLIQRAQRCHQQRVRMLGGKTKPARAVSAII